MLDKMLSIARGALESVRGGPLEQAVSEGVTALEGIVTAREQALASVVQDAESKAAMWLDEIFKRAAGAAPQ
jgi:hypothetical protein